MSFTLTSYFKETFSHTSLLNEDSSGIEFEDCQFIECSFLSCQLANCKFINCQFISSQLSALKLGNSRFVDVNFKNSKVIGIDWTQAQYLQDISFRDCQVNYSNFKLLKLPKLIMVSCEAREIDFSGSDLTESDLTNTDFEGAVFSNTNLYKARLSGAKNYSIDARSNNIKKAHFSLPAALTLLNSLDIILD